MDSRSKLIRECREIHVNKVEFVADHVEELRLLINAIARQLERE
jgi:hypothetical protein